MAAVPEQLRIRNQRAKRGRADKPDARNGLQALALRIALCQARSRFSRPSSCPLISAIASIKPESGARAISGSASAGASLTISIKSGSLPMPLAATANLTHGWLPSSVSSRHPFGTSMPWKGAIHRIIPARPKREPGSQKGRALQYRYDPG